MSDRLSTSSESPPHLLGLALMPLLLAILMLAASLTPSLIPRAWILQGVLGGLMMGIGFMVGQLIRSIWGALGLPRLYGGRSRLIQLALVLPALGLVGLTLWRNAEWQNSIRARLEMPPVEDVHTVLMMLLALATFALTLALGFGIQWVFDRLRRRLYRVIPERTANVVALSAVLLMLFFVISRGIVDPLHTVLDEIYEAAQNLTSPEAEAPTEPWRSGSAESLSDWQRMGKPGRDYVRLGPDAAAISAFTGRPALEPLRVYVGRAQNPDPVARAELALQELIRVDAFDREVLVIASPTGTGWLDPGSHDPLEYLLDGDVATVAVQYSNLQSPIALVFETQSGLDQAVATITTVYDYWKTLPEDARPRLYIHGLSLGAWSSMYAVNIFHILNDPIDGARWAGPPFPSSLWRQVNANRNEGSAYVLPTIDDGNLIRHMNQYGGLESATAPWGDILIVFLQYASDPIVFFEAAATFRRPIWMREEAAPDVYPDLDFTPIVTQFQLAVDMIVSKAVPMGYGHNYEAEDYIDGWVAVAGIDDWTEADLERLKGHCGGDWGMGCQN